MNSEEKSSHSEIGPANSPDGIAAEGFPTQNLQVVAICASAGGVEAISSVIGGLDNDLNAAVIVAMHLSPSHPSQMQGIIRNVTKYPVVVAEDDVALEPGKIFVTPPNADIIQDGKTLRLLPAENGPHPKPNCNRLLESIARHTGENAVAVILSGTGSDGARGVKAIRQAGGVTIVQDPGDAKYDGMPMCAIQTDCVDLILPSPEIAGAILSILQSPTSPLALTEVDDEHDDRRQVLEIVREVVGTDFSYIKAGTLTRRIARRCAINNITSFNDYLVYLKNTPEEPAAFAQSVLISVTTFFRDPEVWRSLRAILERQIRLKSPDDTFRVWVPACATGEEAFSIAMLCLEIMDSLSRPPNLIVFASDLDDDAVRKARLGYYPRTIIGQVSPERLEAFFVRSGDGYQLKNRVRQSVVFSVQDLMSDPPFSRIDFISCRNFMIYLVPDAQRQIFELFHYSLVTHGLLLLGATESNLNASDLFSCGDESIRLYVHQRVPAEYVTTTVRSRMEKPFRTRSTITSPISVSKARSLAESAHYIISNSVASHWVIIDENDIVKFISSACQQFIEAPRGPAILRIYDVLSPSLNLDMRGLIFRARRSGQKTIGLRSFFELDGKRMSVKPVLVSMSPDYPGYWLVLLDIDEVRISGEVRRDNSEVLIDPEYVKDLENRLEVMRQDMQSMSEELETSNEELQSQSEELQSANEELQSTNEQLLTSNEELQSSNEELLTLNDELRERTLQADLQLSLWNRFIRYFHGGVMFFNASMTLQMQSESNGELSLLLEKSPEIGEQIWGMAWKEGVGDEVMRVVRRAKSGAEKVDLEVKTPDGHQVSIHIGPGDPFGDGSSEQQGLLLVIERLD